MTDFLITKINDEFYQLWKSKIPKSINNRQACYVMMKAVIDGRILIEDPRFKSRQAK